MRGKRKWQQYRGISSCSRVGSKRHSFNQKTNQLAYVQSHTHVIANVIQEVQSWKEEFEVTFFDRDEELHYDFFKARSQQHACEVAIEFAKTYFPACNRIHVERLEARCSQKAEQKKRSSRVLRSD